MLKCVPCWDSTVNSKEVLFSFVFRQSTALPIWVSDYIYIYLWSQVHVCHSHPVPFWGQRLEHGWWWHSQQWGLNKGYSFKSHVSEAKKTSDLRDLDSARSNCTSSYKMWNSAECRLHQSHQHTRDSASWFTAQIRTCGPQKSTLNVGRQSVGNGNSVDTSTIWSHWYFGSSELTGSYSGNPETTNVP